MNPPGAHLGHAAPARYRGPLASVDQLTLGGPWLGRDASLRCHRDLELAHAKATFLAQSFAQSSGNPVSIEEFLELL